jgi:hypothetical protein
MKKFSDIFSSMQRKINKVGSRIATTALFMVAATTMAFAQEPYVFTEGSVHNFSVAPNSENEFVWNMYVDPAAGILMPANSYDLMVGGTSPELTIRFNDMNRVSSELVYLVVQETNPSGCSTRRALQIQLEPNNMYLEFASSESQDCYSLSDYQAPLKVGLNFNKEKRGEPIPESFFPLKVTYTIENVTAGTPAVPGNGGDSLTIQFNPANDYSLLVKMPEAVGLPNKTTEYVLTITSVTDKYQTSITDYEGGKRMQIRIINHLPQSGSMDMALAYYIVK